MSDYCLLDVLNGLDTTILSSNARASLVSLPRDMDVMGRLAGQSLDDPLIDQHSLRAHLEGATGRDIANSLIEELRSLPGEAFRPASSGATTTDLREVPWFRLAEHIVIFDTAIDARAGSLQLSTATTPANVADAVQISFPSLEERILVEDGRLPRALATCVEPLAATSVLTELARQLGWWAAVVGAVLIGQAKTCVELHASGDETAASYWPLVMFLMAAAVGGWTLTVVGGVALGAAEGERALGRLSVK